MNECKLSSFEVPQKLIEWLLTMGCPAEEVPSLDKITEMCRGEYYIVWRSLMEKVEPKDVVRNKRLQVFSNDVNKCRKKSIFNERDSNVVIPEELTLWRHQTQLKEKVADAEARTCREHLQKLMDKVSSKLSQRYLILKQLEDAQRRSWLLHQVAEELRDRREKLLETRTIADSLCEVDEGADVESKVDKCVSALIRHTAANKAGVTLIAAANPAACSSVTSTNSDVNDDEIISSLVKWRGEVLYKQLYERRVGLCARISVSHMDKTNEDNRISQSVLAHTAALQCNLALESMKNKVHINNTRNRLVAVINELDNDLTGEACELLVMRCEKACVEARLSALRALCDELHNGRGIFTTGAPQFQGGATTSVNNIDRAIESKRDELRRLITSAAAVEKKTQNVKECLLSLFSKMHEIAREGDRFGGRSSFTQESISTLRQFYNENRERRNNKVELSMDFDVSENSFTDVADNGNVKFVNELKLYMKNFNLEKNRKLILESGAKIWISETLDAFHHEIHTKWQSEDITTSLLCPSVNLNLNLRRLAQNVATKAELGGMVSALENGERRTEMNIDISPKIAYEQKILDKIKKRLNDNILSLQKSDKTLDTCMENLELWEENNFKKYISEERSVGGMSFRAIDAAFCEAM